MRDQHSLSRVILAAKADCYVGGRAGDVLPDGRHVIGWQDGAFRYQDSYVGGTAFAGQETLWQDGVPDWSMVYFGRVLRDDLIDGARAADVIRAALAAMYRAGRFLGGWDQDVGDCRYEDRNRGDVFDFTGQERILIGGIEVYRLDYAGGLVRA
jgi:hypothetical protein